MGRALDYIAARVAKIPGVTARVSSDLGGGRSNRSPRMTIRWDSKTLGITGADVADLLYDGEPRIALGGGGGGGARAAPARRNCPATPASRSAPR